MRMSVTPVARVAREDRGRDRRRAAVARQERGVEVERAVRTAGRASRRDEPAVVGEHEEVGPELREGSVRLGGGAQPFGRQDREPRSCGSRRPRATASGPARGPTGRGGAVTTADERRRTDASRAPRGRDARRRRCRGRRSWPRRSPRYDQLLLGRLPGRQRLGLLLGTLRLGHLAQTADRNELVERLEVVDVELAREVVELVLDGPREEAGARRCERGGRGGSGPRPTACSARLRYGEVARGSRGSPRGRGPRRRGGRCAGSRARGAGPRPR